MKFQAELQNLNNEIRKLGININQISASLNYAKKHGGMNKVIDNTEDKYSEESIARRVENSHKR